MAKGSQLIKIKKNDSTPSSQKSSKPKTAKPAANKDVEKQVSPDQVRCVECENVIREDTKTLNSVKCLKSWKCTSCIGIRASTYDDLISDAGKELLWFCVPCRTDILSQTSSPQLVGALREINNQNVGDGGTTEQ